MLLLALLACQEADTVPSPGSDTADSGGEGCVDEEAVFVDWMEWGEHAVGRSLYAGITELNGSELPLEVQISYPARSEGQDAEPAEGPFPVIFFEHAYGADYLNSDWLLDRLASRGFVTFSAGHNGSWDTAGDWWNDHAALFVDTAELARDWNGDASSPFHGLLDLETTALMGHSHGGGAALQVMWELEPDAVVLITPRPSLDSALSSYHDAYDGMPPLLNVAASRDEDSTTAWGTSIAVYEALARPRFMITVEGASHYTFTDEASIAASDITREEGQIAGGSAVIAFLEYLLHGDTRGLRSLRGEVDLFEPSLGAAARLQSHPDGEIVVDDFENSSSSQGVAIAGIEGQTFVNGFLGDTFVDFEHGVALLVAEIEALSEPGDRVLFYQDASRGTDAYAEALSRLDRELTSVSVDSAFEELLGQEWELVIATQQDGNSTDQRPFDDELAAAICDGQRAILSDFRTASTTAAATFACAGAGFDGTTNWTTMSAASELFEGELRVQNSSWGIFSYGLSDARQVFATNETVVTGVADPDNGPLGPVEASGALSIREISAHDSSRALYMPTQALELTWTDEGELRWSLDESVDARGRAVALRVLQLHDDPLNGDEVGLTLRVQDAAGGVGERSFTVQPTPRWLESTTPKSVFETLRVELSELGIDASQVQEIHLAAAAGSSGRILVDDLELSPTGSCGGR